METKKMPLEGLIILKRLNTKESERGVDLDDTEYVFASKSWADIARKLAKFPSNRLDWLIVAKFKQNEQAELEYEDGVTGLDFLKQAQAHLDIQIRLN